MWSAHMALTAFHRHDFNDEIDGGNAFCKLKDWHTDTMVKWSRYSEDAFEADGEGSVDNEQEMSRGARRDLPLDDVGLPLIPPLDGEDTPSLPVMKTMIRDFLTAHYRMSPVHTALIRTLIAP